jgi:hypothetical protein
MGEENGTKSLLASREPSSRDKRKPVESYEQTEEAQKSDRRERKGSRRAIVTLFVKAIGALRCSAMLYVLMQYVANCFMNVSVLSLPENAILWFTAFHRYTLASVRE